MIRESYLYIYIHSCRTKAMQGNTNISYILEGDSGIKDKLSGKHFAFKAIL